MTKSDMIFMYFVSILPAFLVRQPYPDNCQAFQLCPGTDGHNYM